MGISSMDGPFRISVEARGIRVLSHKGVIQEQDTTNGIFLLN